MGQIIRKTHAFQHFSSSLWSSSLWAHKVLSCWLIENKDWDDLHLVSFWKHGYFGVGCLAKCRAQFIIPSCHGNAVPNWKNQLKNFNINLRSSQEPCFDKIHTYRRVSDFAFFCRHIFMFCILWLCNFTWRNTMHMKLFHSLLTNLPKCLANLHWQNY